MIDENIQKVNVVLVLVKSYNSIIVMTYQFQFAASTSCKIGCENECVSKDIFIKGMKKKKKKRQLSVH